MDNSFLIIFCLENGLTKGLIYVCTKVLNIKYLL